MKYFSLILLVILLPGCQSGCFSRYGGSSAKLPVPSDCVRVISMGHSDRGKFLCYLSRSGVVKMKEYSDFEILEAEYEVDGATFDNNLNRQ